MKTGVIVCCLATILIGGCTTFRDMDTGLQGMIGKPKEVAFSQLGYPTQEGKIAGRTVYIWGRSFSAPEYTPTSSTTNGQIGSIPFSATTSSGSWSSASYDCTIRVFIDDEGIIRNADYDGNIGGCQAYAKRLRRNH